MRNFRLLKVLAFVVALGVTAPLLGQPGPRVDESFRRARQVLDAASQAVGPDFDAISYRVDGKLYARDQSPHADGAPVALDFHGALLFDLKHDRLTWEAAAVFPGGFNFHGLSRVKDGKGVNSDLVGHTNTPIPNTGPLREIIGLRIPRYLIN